MLKVFRRVHFVAKDAKKHFEEKVNYVQTRFRPDPPDVRRGRDIQVSVDNVKEGQAHLGVESNPPGSVSLFYD